MPLKVVYVDDARNQRNDVASYSFGSGTLHGHLLVQFLYCVIVVIALYDFS